MGRVIHASSLPLTGCVHDGIVKGTVSPLATAIPAMCQSRNVLYSEVFLEMLCAWSEDSENAGC